MTMPPRLLLAFDHSVPLGSLCLWREGEPCVRLRLSPPAEHLPQVLHRVLSEQALPYSALSDLCVVRGPGSYTGLRASLAAAQALALAVRGLRVYSLTAFEAARLLRPRESVLAVIESFRSVWYGQFFPEGERAEVWDDAGLRARVLALRSERSDSLVLCGSAARRAFETALRGVEGLVLEEGESTAFEFARPLAEGEDASLYRVGAGALSPLYGVDLGVDLGLPTR